MSIFYVHVAYTHMEDDPMKEHMYFHAIITILFYINGNG